MTTSALPRRRHGWRAIALAVVIAAAPLPAWAGDSSPPHMAKPGIRASAQKFVAQQVAAPASPVRQTRLAAAQQTDLGSTSFFRTPAGIITIVAVAAGVGYTLYSTSNDRVKSPAR